MNPITAASWDEVQSQLLATMPYQVKPGAVRFWKDNEFPDGHHRCQPIPYVDREDVQTRLDAVLGPFWQMQVELLDPAKLIFQCRIAVFIDGNWQWRADVGAPQGGDEIKHKAALSDAFKRCATMWGVGRFLYSLPKIWVPCRIRKDPNDAKSKDRFDGWMAGHDPLQAIERRRQFLEAGGYEPEPQRNQGPRPAAQAAAPPPPPAQPSPAPVQASPAPPAVDGPVTEADREALRHLARSCNYSMREVTLHMQGRFVTGNLSSLTRAQLEAMRDDIQHSRIRRANAA